MIALFVVLGASVLASAEDSQSIDSKYYLGKYFNTTTRERTNCPVGEYQDEATSNATSCKKSPPGTYVATIGQGVYQRCMPGSFNTGLGNVDCENCPAGTYQYDVEQTQCPKCPKGAQSTSGSMTCTAADQDSSCPQLAANGECNVSNRFDCEGSCWKTPIKQKAEAVCGHKPPQAESDGFVWNAAPNAWPWLVSIFAIIHARRKSFARPVYDHVCNGVLVSDQWVLLPASCDTDKILVGALVAAHNLSSPVKRFVPIEQIIMHPNYSSSVYGSTWLDAQHLANNMALVKLSHPVSFLYQDMKPACLPSNSFLPALTSKPLNCFFSGWGRNKYISDPIKYKYYPRMTGVVNETNYVNWIQARRDIFDDKQFTFQLPGWEYCMAEGAILNCEFDGRWYVMAMQTYGSWFAMNMAFTNLAFYTDWIQEVIFPKE